MPRPARDTSDGAAAGTGETHPRRRDAPLPGPRTADAVADTLRAAILSGELAPGTPLREEELSATHGISRHTARTALATLTAERLATAEPYRGVRVSQLDDDALIALQQLRCALETEALRIVRHRGIHPPRSTVPSTLSPTPRPEATGREPSTRTPACTWRWSPRRGLRASPRSTAASTARCACCSRTCGPPTRPGR